MPEGQERKLIRYYVDWWQIRKATVYGLIAVVLIVGGLSYGGWYAYKNNIFFGNVGDGIVPKDSARLTSFEGDVRIIRAATRETVTVTSATYVSAGDTIQTQADGKAQIEMIDGSTLTVRPNSTVVIRDSASIFGGTNVRVALDGGQINLRTENQTETSQNVVELKETESRVFGQTEATFNINQKTNTGEIRIARGGVESNAGGEKTIIKDGEFAAITPNGKLTPKEKLLGSPKLLSPASLDQILTSSSGTADINFRWQKADPNVTTTFRFEIATSPFFVADGIITQQDPLNAPSFTYANIQPGTYYWRVRSIASSGQTSEWSEPSKFVIVRREGNVTLSASDWNVENVGGNVYLIGGKTLPGATVRILGRENFAQSDGSFKVQARTPSSEVTVEISDEHGNQSRFVISLSTSKVVRHY